MVATSVSSVKAYTKANYILETEKKKKGEKLTTEEKIKYTLPVYISPILIGSGTIACIIGANVLNKKHQAALTQSYFLLNESFKQYRNKTKELYGEEADEKIEEAIEEDNNTNGDEQIHLFYDEYSERYFESTFYKVQRAEYELNRNLMMRDYVYLNEWYEALDLDIVDEGYALGWTPCMLMDFYWQPWLDFDHEYFKTEDGRECISINFWQGPIKDFEEYC